MGKKSTSEKRILFLGNIHGSSTSLYYFVNLVRMGYSVYPYDPDYFTPRPGRLSQPRSWWNHLQDDAHLRLRKQPSPGKQQQVEEELLSLCKKSPFDVVFSMSQNFLRADALRLMKGESTTLPTLIYHSHDNNFSSGILKASDFEESIAAYDCVFTTKSQNVERYRALGQENAFFIPSAYEPSVHRKIPHSESLYQPGQFPLSFIGTFDHSRVPLLEALGWQHLYIWGDHWEGYRDYYSHADRIYPNAIYHFEYADVLSHTQVALGLLREEAYDLHTQRTFEIPACGTLQISPRNEEILSFFKENKEIVCFGSKEELVEKVAYYLKHPEKAKAIAAKGHERCLKDKHSYQDRIVQILSQSEKRTRLFLAKTGS